MARRGGRGAPDRREVARGNDQVADPEEPVVPELGLVEVVLGAAHQRCGAERVTDFVDVTALEVLEDRDRADGEVNPPVGRHPGVDAPPAARPDQCDQPVDFGALSCICAPLRRDRGGVVAVVGTELEPGGGEHEDHRRQREHAPHRPNAGDRPCPPGTFLRCVAQRGTCSPVGTGPRQKQGGELGPHHEAAKEEVTGPGYYVDQRPERGPAKGQHQACRQRDEERPRISVLAPANTRERRADGGEQRYHR